MLCKQLHNYLTAIPHVVERLLINFLISLKLTFFIGFLSFWFSLTVIRLEAICYLFIIKSSYNNIS